MGKGLGIAVLVVAVIAIIIPIYGIYLGIITSLLGIAVAAMKEQAMAIAIGALNILDALFLSPSLVLAGAGAQLAHSSSISLIFWLWVGSGIVTIILAITMGRQSRTASSVQG
jgi:hypothetical protein